MIPLEVHFAFIHTLAINGISLNENKFSPHDYVRIRFGVAHRHGDHTGVHRTLGTHAMDR